MLRILPVVVAVAVVVAAGLVHGFWTDRWGVGEAVAEAAASLDRVPRSVGDWQAEPLDSDQGSVPGVAGQLYLRYVNRKTGDSVSIALVCGRPGPVCIHTPDVCYAAIGHTVREVTSEIPLEQDPCLDFLRQFLPEAQKALVGGSV